jgi:hypothetical protein
MKINLFHTLNMNWQVYMLRNSKYAMINFLDIIHYRNFYCKRPFGDRSFSVLKEKNIIGPIGIASPSLLIRPKGVGFLPSERDSSVSDRFRNVISTKDYNKTCPENRSL